MRHVFQQRGAEAAWAAYGLRKTSGVMSLLERAGPQGLRGLKAVGRGASSVGDVAKRMLIGHPTEALNQLRSGTLHQPGGLLREAFVPRGKIDALMTYGLPAYSIYQASQAPAGQRGSAIGGMIGMNLGGMLGQPLGMVGSMAGSTLLDGLGQSLGGMFDRKDPEN